MPHGQNLIELACKSFVTLWVAVALVGWLLWLCLWLLWLWLWLLWLWAVACDCGLWLWPVAVVFACGL